MQFTATSGVRAHTIAVTLARVALDLDLLSAEIEQLDAAEVEQEFLFTSAWRHAQIASDAIDDVLGRKATEAERKMGELLGPATRDHDRRGLSDRQSDSEYKSRERARAVAAIPQDEFDNYIAEAERGRRDAQVLQFPAPPIGVAA